VALAKLQQRTTPDTVADSLREAILDGSLKAGSQLRETHISAELGISRAPLREALRRLEEEGLVVKIPFKGAFVAEVSRQSIDDISRLRSVLEPWAIEQGLTTLQGTRLPELRRIIAALASAAKSGNVQKSIDAHLAFHRAVYESAGNKALADIWRSWESQLRLFLAADLRNFDDPMEVRDTHASMLDLIERGDLLALKHELRYHIHGVESLPTEGAKPPKASRISKASRH
jgi:DNA-binding GntR family transcriptional regulator